ncbi:hypothetical protein LTR67_007599 [Exophiala xenobiotica]
MGRRQFLNHLADASLPTIANIEGVHTPEEGVVSFIYCRPDESSTPKVNIQACATSLDDYPHDNSFMLFTDDDHVDAVIPQTLQSIGAQTHGKSLSDVLSEVSLRLTAALVGGHDDVDGLDTTMGDTDDGDFDFEYDSDDAGFGLADLQPGKSTVAAGSSNPRILSNHTSVSSEKIRADVRALKEAGFRVGIFGNLASSGILCVSIRVSRLGLSEEAMQAWSLRRKQYLIFLIRYVGGYCEASKITQLSDVNSRMELHVALCEHYKPPLSDVNAVFQANILQKDGNTSEVSGLLEPLFIGKPLNQFLADRFINIIKARHIYRLSWLGAEKMVEARQMFTSDTTVDNLKDYQCDDKAQKTTQLPAVVMADHMAQVALERASLPLIAMQFVLRHFVRCTEFCLVCHCRVDDSFEALKPYVCSKPLCLYQYMTLGFGPSLEWDICSQPYVVDLLVSFCNVAASTGRVKDLPVGLNLTVPVLPHYSVPFAHYNSRAIPPPNPPTGRADTPPATSDKTFGCTWHADAHRLEDVDNDFSPLQRLRPGDWVVTISTEHRVSAHHRVKKALPSSIELDEPVFVAFTAQNQGQQQPTTSAPSNAFKKGMKANCYIYNKSFDDLTAEQQQHAIVTLLSALPSIGEMCKYLKSQGRGRDGNLRSWQRIPESSLNLLRWVVASNRSCILQVDQLEDDPYKNGTNAEDRVGGMEGYMQFRFAQGAPDKEKRFNDAVQAGKAATGTKYPTLFAWHGSRLANWHSIVRQGLRFDEVVNGRAYGNGVYLSPHAATSLGYAHAEHVSQTMGNVSHDWKPSMLKITSAFSLNEVVNNPVAFVSSSPHYVVSQIDWIQTRYLFVRVSSAFKFTESNCRELYTQDPARQIHSDSGKSVTIPLAAISKTRRAGNSVQMARMGSGKRTKSVVEIDQATAERQEDDAESVVSDAADLAFLTQDMVDDCGTALREKAGISSPGQVPPSPSLKRPADLLAETDFVPGALDVGNIKFLEPPKDATSASTQALMRALREALSVQDKTPLATLGWYIDKNLINNMYQWIVELHSFPAKLPLTSDMKSANIKSVVLEMRFSNQFPFSPPFIRVIKPRFLPFAQGGGGNVTEGGAMCMEALTNNGWTAAQNIESLLLQVRMAICDEERPARLASARSHGRREHDTYGVGEAVAAYIRACQNHGWTVPPGFDKFQRE